MAIGAELGAAIPLALGGTKGAVSNVKNALAEAKADDNKVSFKEGANIYFEGLKGTLGGFYKGLTGKDSNLLSDYEKDQELLAKEQARAEAIAANQASIQQANTGNDISTQASMNPAYGNPVFNPQQSNTIQSVFDPNRQTSVV